MFDPTKSHGGFETGLNNIISFEGQFGSCRFLLSFVPQNGIKNEKTCVGMGADVSHCGGISPLAPNLWAKTPTRVVWG